MAKIIGLDAHKKDEPAELPPGWEQHPVEQSQFVKVQGALAFQVTRNPPMPPNIPAGARPKAALTAMNIAENKAATTYHGSDTEAFAYADLIMAAASYSQVIAKGIPPSAAKNIINCLHEGRQSGTILDSECTELEKLVRSLVEPEVSNDEKPLTDTPSPDTQG